MALVLRATPMALVLRATPMALVLRATPMALVLRATPLGSVPASRCCRRRGAPKRSRLRGSEHAFDHPAASGLHPGAPRGRLRASRGSMRGGPSGIKSKDGWSSEGSRRVAKPGSVATLGQHQSSRHRRGR
jgi:hypothetical protein